MSRTAVRIFLLLLAVLAVASGGAVEARGETAPPTLELVSPAPGAKVVVSLEQRKWPVYRFRVTFPTGYEGTRVVMLEHALDAGFTQNKSGDGKSCAAAVAVCDLTSTSQTNYAPGTRVFWRVSIPDTIVSPTRSFVATGIAVSDRDHDGIADAKDNCPAVRNPKQTDFEHDGKGDACQPDRTTPRVKAYSGSERRGQHAQFHFRAVDNRPVTIRVVLRWNGRAVLRGWMPNVAARHWGGVGDELQWESGKPIDSSFPIGSYTFCVSAQDAAGHKASSCAPYKITA